MGRDKRPIVYHEDDFGDEFSKIEKIKTTKRSVRGRTIDDWLLTLPESKKDRKKVVESMRQKKEFLGRVIEVQKRNIFIAEESIEGAPETENLWLCSIAKRHFQRSHKERNFVVVGDLVVFQPDKETELSEDGEPLNTDLPRGVIQHALPRHSKISRRDPMRPEWEHIMLANIDLLAIVASTLNPPIRFGLIDRFLVQAEMEGIPVVIILNKNDLLSDPKLATPDYLALYNKRVEIYRQIGYDVFEISSLHYKNYKTQIQKIRTLFKGKIIGFCGHSGVGKSSLLNLMKPEFDQIVDENPDIFYKGRHTTTYNSLLHLGIGAYAIDTPGIRSFAIDNYDPIVLTACFPEMRNLKCKFRHCSHDQEDFCAVKEAVKTGQVSLERYRSFLGILKNISFREGELSSEDADVVADLKARKQFSTREQTSLPEQTSTEDETE